MVNHLSSDFHNVLSTAFLSIRKHSSFLVASFVNISTCLGFPEDEVQIIRSLFPYFLNSQNSFDYFAAKTKSFDAQGCTIEQHGDLVHFRYLISSKFMS
jgi:hypothetical protein